jgi:hypothetical protein
MKIFLRVQFIALITFSESEFGHQRIHRSGKKVVLATKRFAKFREISKKKKFS